MLNPIPPKTPNALDDDDDVVVDERDCFTDEDAVVATETMSGDAWDEHDDEDDEAPSLSLRIIHRK